MKIDTPDKTPISFFFLEHVSPREQICEPKLHGYCNYHPPSAVSRVWGSSGNYQDIFPVLRKPAWPLCTFIGHRGAENKITPPPNNTDRQHEFVLQLLSYLTYFLLLPDSFKCHLLARCLWKCRQLLSSFVFPLGTTTTAMSKVGQNRMISPKQFKVLWAVWQAQKHFL